MTLVPFFAHFLFILAAWTLTIKFAFPIAYAFAHDLPALQHVYWDFWWVVHIWLGWALLHRPRHTFALAVAVSTAEIVIVVAKMVLFLSAPNWNIWLTNWFVNKMFVLACFTLILAYALFRRDSFRDQLDRVANKS